MSEHSGQTHPSEQPHQHTPPPSAPSTHEASGAGWSYWPQPASPPHTQPFFGTGAHHAPGAPYRTVSGMPGAPLHTTENSDKTRHRLAVAALAAALAVGSGLVGGVVGASINGNSDGAPHNQVVSATSHNSASTASSIDTIKKAKKSAVSIETGDASGSGIVITESGYVLTNNHVITDVHGRTVQLTLSNNDKVPARIVKADAKNDLALLKAEGGGSYQPATLADSDSTQVGETVYAIGSPLGLDGSASVGIVSALGRDLSVSEGGNSGSPPGGFGQRTSNASPDENLTGLFQTDAAINPGSSGGPLVNAGGQVVGINTAIAGESNAGIGFAIPINKAKEFIGSELD